MRYSKVYGQSQLTACPFCGMQAITKNGQGVPTCRAHASKQMPELKCMCGKWLDQKESKFGVFYTCMSCGTVSFSRMMEINGEKIRAAATSAPATFSRSDSAPSRPPNLRDKIKEKLARGEALTPDEVDLL